MFALAFVQSGHWSIELQKQLYMYGAQFPTVNNFLPVQRALNEVNCELRMRPRSKTIFLFFTDQKSEPV